MFMGLKITNEESQLQTESSCIDGKKVRISILCDVYYRTLNGQSLKENRHTHTILFYKIIFNNT